jgi:acid stress-induced BolA-like protein IbaG/YrbA
VRELLKRGLAAEGIEVAGDGAKSQDFGVLADAENIDQAITGNQ